MTLGHEINKSEWVYDTKGGGDYIQCAVESLGISDEQLIRNVTPRISKDIKDTSTIAWPQNIDEESEELSPLLMHLLTSLKHPNKSTVDIS